MDWITDYKITSGVDADELTERVQAGVADGWQPWGSPYSAAGSRHCQAVVRTQEGLRRFETEKMRTSGGLDQADETE